MSDVTFILERLEQLFPDAHCELEHSTPFQLMVAVVLSAQTTDVRVNQVTKSLFECYPDAYSLSLADIKEVERLIRSIGLYQNKAKHIVSLSKKLVSRFNGIVPSTMEELITLDGVGRKSANVILSVCFNVPAIAVDTHVERVSKRLGLVSMDKSVLETEKELMRKIPMDKWSIAHHLFIFFGRYKCTSRSPQCHNCPFQMRCCYYRDEYLETNLNEMWQIKK